MLYINKVSNDASQLLTLTGIPNITIQMALYFNPRTTLWTMDITYGSFVVQGLNVVANLNILRQWKNIIPFGIQCICPDGLDPYQVNDFADQRSLLFLLNAADVAQIEADWFT